MNIQNFKEIRQCNFKDFNLSTLEYYITEGHKLLANAREIDPEIVEIIANLETEMFERRG
jgi:hypothetical protein